MLLMLNALNSNSQLSRRSALNHNSQNIWILKEYSTDHLPILTTDTLLYCGLDFSEFILKKDSLNAPRATTISDITYWTDQFKRYCVGRKGNSRLSETLKKEIATSEEMNSHFSLMANPRVDTVDQRIDKESIQRIINSYPKLKNNNAIAFTIIMESFDTRMDRVIMNFAFFDPSDNALLWTMKIQAPVKNFDSREAWARGMNSAFFRFQNMYHKRIRAWRKEQ
ncbi:MAG: hypothetical protein ACI837_000857 [Crocinitomicaceae bacterium]|jgi:hypothetical protein